MQQVNKENEKIIEKLIEEKKRYGEGGEDDNRFRAVKDDFFSN